MERTQANLSHIRACRGKCSQICTPGTLVWMGRNSPRYSTGASGLRSYMSMCDGPLLREPPGERVLLAGVVAAEQPVRPRDRLGAVAESGPAVRGVTQAAERAQHAVPGEPAQADDHAGARQQPELGGQVAQAVV